MPKTKFCKYDPTMLTALSELDYLVKHLKQILNSLEPGSKNSVNLNRILERTKRLRKQIACMSNKDVDWAGIIQAIVCVAQYLTRLWG